MKEVEINRELSLTEQQAIYVDMHSLLNVMNVIYGELHILKMIFNNTLALKNSMGEIERIIDHLNDKEKVFSLLREAGRFRDLIFKDIDAAARMSGMELPDEDTRESLDNLESVFRILEVRAGELESRLNEPTIWRPHKIADLKSNYLQVLDAITENSKGRYRIVTNRAIWTNKDYLVHLEIQSEEGNMIHMPPVLQDVMRDLIANARKYSSPGSRITAGLWQDAEKVRLVVEDEGRGIPEDQLEEVVEMGKRARNTKPEETRGGGFGLTKAWYVTKQHQGRMWIASEIETGSRITIELPVPKE